MKKHYVLDAIEDAVILGVVLFFLDWTGAIEINLSTLVLIASLAFGAVLRIAVGALRDASDRSKAAR